jgi:hypothetical protein
MVARRAARVTSVTLQDILNLPAPVIGALAVLCAAAFSAVMVMLTALVNTRSARRIARDNFRRELLSKNLKPFVEKLDEQIAALARFHNLVIDSKKWRLESPSPEEHERAASRKKRVDEFNAVRQQLESAMSWLESSGSGVIIRDQRLMDLNSRLLAAQIKCVDVLVAESKTAESDSSVSERMFEVVSTAQAKAVVLRVAIDETIIDPPGWLSRRVYGIRRYFMKDRWEKILE